MGKTKITEFDMTSPISKVASSNIVYVPVAASEAIEPTLCHYENELKGITGLNSSHLSYKLALHLLKLGMFVLVEGIAITDSEDSEDSESTEETGYTIPEASWKRLEDKGLYDIRFITTGGLCRFNADALKCAEAREDCVYVASVDKKDSIAAVREEVNSVLLSAGLDTKGSTYASVFYPDFETESADFKKGTGFETIPAEFGYLFAYAKACQNYPEWYAAAGSFRGIIDEMKEPVVKLTTAECEQLQARAATGEVELDDPDDNWGFAINPISWVRPFGYLVNGNRTIFISPKDEIKDEVNLKASAFLNVRNLTNTIKKALYDAANKWRYEQNTEALWVNFKNEIVPLLDRMSTANGLAGYQFNKGVTEKKARLKAVLHIIPIEAVEDFDIDIYLQDSLESVEVSE